MHCKFYNNAITTSKFPSLKMANAILVLQERKQKQKGKF